MNPRGTAYHDLLYHLVRYVGDCARLHDTGSIVEVGFTTSEAQQILGLTEGECQRVSAMLARSAEVMVDPEGFAWVLQALRSPLLPAGPAGQRWGRVCGKLVEAFIRFVWREVAARRGNELFHRGLTQEQVTTLLGFDLAVFDKATSVAHHGLRVHIPAGLVSRGLARITEERQDESLASALVALGAPRAMLATLFGWSKERFQIERARLGRCDRGRPRAPSEAQEHRVWASWRQHQDQEIRQRYQAVALATQVEVGIIWRLTQAWES
jgi:hypothetical protein